MQISKRNEDILAKCEFLPGNKTLVSLLTIGRLKNWDKRVEKK